MPVPAVGFRSRCSQRWMSQVRPQRGSLTWRQTLSISRAGGRETEAEPSRGNKQQQQRIRTTAEWSCRHNRQSSHRRTGEAARGNCQEAAVQLGCDAQPLSSWGCVRRETGPRARTQDTHSRAAC